MTLVKLAIAWGKNELTEEELLEAVKTIDIFIPNETDEEDIIYSIGNGNSVAEVDWQVNREGLITREQYVEFMDIVFNRK